jgi:hypothetical protein
LQAAHAVLKETGERVVREEPRSAAMLVNPSREEAWNALFALLSIISFVALTVSAACLAR